MIVVVLRGGHVLQFEHGTRVTDDLLFPTPNADQSASAIVVHNADGHQLGRFRVKEVAGWTTGDAVKVLGAGAA